MSDTAGVTKIEDVVDRFVYMYRAPMDDWNLYLEHACAFWRQMRVHHGGGFKEEKVAVDADGFITMPTDLLDLIDIYLPKDGGKRFFTRNDNIVPTLTDGSFDESYGEGADVTDARTTSYGAVGGVNDYYYLPIWENREILVKGVTSANVTLIYKSSGIVVDSTTYVPALAEDVIVAKLKKELAYIEGRAIGEQQLREQEFKEALAMFRKTQMPSLNEVKDAFRSVTTQAPTRYE